MIARKFLRTTVSVLVLILIGFFLCAEWKFHEKQRVNKILQLARSIAATLPQKDLKELKGFKQDIDKPQYLAIRQKLREIVLINANARFAYLYTLRDDHLYLMASSEPQESPLYYPPGEDCSHLDLVFRKPFQRGTPVFTGRVKGKTGTWLSVLIPMKDENTGHTYAVYGMQYNSSQWDRGLLKDMMETSAMIIFLLIVASFLEVVIRKNKMLKLKIAEKSRAEQALKMSREAYKKVLDNVHEIIYSVSFFGTPWKGHVNFIGGQMEKIIGYTAKEFIEDSELWFSIIHPDDKNLVFSSTEEGFKNGKIETRSYRMKHKLSGEYIWVEDDATFEKDDQGQIIGQFGTTRDINDRKKAELTIAHSHYLMNYIIEHDRGPVAVHDKDLKYIYVSQKYLKDYQIQENIIGKHHYEVFPDLPERWRTVHQKALKGEVIYAEDDLYEKENGTKIWTRWECRPWYETDHSIGGIIIYSEVITEQKKAQQELIRAKYEVEQLLDETLKQKSEIELNKNRLESLLRIAQYKPESNKDLLDYALQEATKLSSSKLGYIFHYNESTRQLTWSAWSGEVMKECRVKNPKLTYDLDTTGCWGEPIRRRKAIVVNDFRDYTPFLRGMPTGHVSLTNFMSVPVFSNGSIVGVLGVANKEGGYNQSDVQQLTLLMDVVWKILERTVMNKHLLEAKEKAEESERLKSAFLANMSHEIRTPMNGIIGFAELLKEPKLSGRQRQEYLRLIEKSGQRMLNIINDIVTISKVESGQMKVILSETNIQQKMEYVLAFFKPEAEKKGIRLLLKFNLADTNSILFTDKDKLFAVLMNLVKNAIKFTLEGSVELGCEAKDRYLEFYVKDTGIGIPLKQQKIIFERFRQANETMSRKYEGAGLGLSISKAYVEMLGGKIWLESHPQAGSTFYFTLPHDCQSEKESMQEAKSLLYPSYSNPQFMKLRILIAEDDETSSVLLDTLCRPYAKNISVVKTGKEAVEFCRNNPDIDLVLMDIKMPDMDGYLATREIRKFNPEVKIIAQTAFALSGDEEKALKAGCDDYTSKPISKETLKKLMHKYFNCSGSASIDFVI